MPEWAYNVDRKYYRDLGTGRFTSRKQIQSWVGESITRSQTVTETLSHLLADDLLRLDDWTILMRQEIKREYVRQYMLGRGGLGQMTQIDYGSLGGMLKEQYGWLDKFAAEIASGQLSEMLRRTS